MMKSGVRQRIMRTQTLAHGNLFKNREISDLNDEVTRLKALCEFRVKH